MCVSFFFSSDIEPVELIMFSIVLLLKSPIDILKAALWTESSVLIVAYFAPTYRIEQYSTAEKISKLCICCSVLVSASHSRLLLCYIVFLLY